MGSPATNRRLPACFPFPCLPQHVPMHFLLLAALLAALGGGGRVLGFPARGSVLRPPDVSYQAASAANGTWVEVQHTAWGSGVLLDSTTALSTDECVAACLDYPECAWCSWCGLEVSGGGAERWRRRRQRPGRQLRSAASPLLLPAPAAGRLHTPAAANGLPGLLALQRQLHVGTASGRQRPASRARLGCVLGERWVSAVLSAWQ